jgi:MFS superfamily sulfate permease-like transporter
VPIHDDGEGFENRFRPLRPASRTKLILAIVLGTVLWAVALAVVAVIVKYTDAIAVGLLVALASFVVSAIMLSLLRQGRLRQERRYADRA